MTVSANAETERNGQFQKLSLGSVPADGQRRYITATMNDINSFTEEKSPAKSGAESEPCHDMPCQAPPNRNEPNLGDPHPTITIISLHSSDYEPLGSYTKANHEKYAAANGYECRHAVLAEVAIAASGLPANWHKIGMLMDWQTEKAMKPKQWALWIDADAIFTSLRPTFSVIEATGMDEYDVVFPADEHGINSGVFLISNTVGAARFLAKVWILKARYRDHQWAEQAAIQELTFAPYPGCGVGIIRRDLINAYPRDWKEGDLICHDPGGGLVTDRLARLKACTQI